MLHTCQRDRYKFLNEGRGFIGKWAFITRFVKKKTGWIEMDSEVFICFPCIYRGKVQFKVCLHRR